jgi:hypothetical protein
MVQRDEALRTRLPRRCARLMGGQMAALCRDNRIGLQEGSLDEQDVDPW